MRDLLYLILEDGWQLVEIEYLCVEEWRVPDVDDGRGQVVALDRGGVVARELLSVERGWHQHNLAHADTLKVAQPFR